MSSFGESFFLSFCWPARVGDSGGQRGDADGCEAWYRYCDTFSKCHGWGDRLRGLQTTLLLALLCEFWHSRNLWGDMGASQSPGS